MNPYAAPAAIPFERATLVVKEHQPRPLRAFGRWTLICAISAAPSFFWGCALHAEPHQLAAMICGILVFVLAYTLIECTHYYHQIISLPHVHRTAILGYGTRVLISVIFPVGLFVDMFTGMWAVTFVQQLFPNSLEVGHGKSAASFLQVFITTIVQGTFLNGLLLIYMLVVYSILRLFSQVRIRWARGDRRRVSRNASP
ncbi:MAG: hypothetical protein CMJ64_08650 [Planctomycetaceae bacterium]|nr:hypothetical protein [Planctomycetaceae bacterium]